MVWVIRIVVVLMGGLFLMMGLNFLINHIDAAARFFVTPDGPAGFSNIRGDVAGMFLGLGTFCLIGLKPGAQYWLHAAAVLLGWIALGRLFGFVLDGTPDSAVIAFVAELVFILLLIIAAQRLKVSA